MSTSSPPPHSDGIIIENARRETRIYWTATVAVIGIILPLLILNINIRPHDPIAWLELSVVLGFGAWVLTATLRMPSRRRKFGLSRFHMLTNPGAIGGRLSGTIVTGRPVQMDT